MTTNDQPSTQGFHGTGWMYEDGAVAINKEEYLLGKKVGRNYEAEGTVGQINAVEYDVAPPSIFASRATHQVGRPPTCHLPPVTCHMPPVTCHLSPFT